MARKKKKDNGKVKRCTEHGISYSGNECPKCRLALQVKPLPLDSGGLSVRPRGNNPLDRIIDS